MKNLFLVIPALFCLVKTGKAQDQLFRKDNTKVLVKITEVNPEEIKYKLFDNLSGPIHSESKSNISLIIYENGQHEIINVAPSPASVAETNNTAYYRGPDILSKSDSLTYYGHQHNISINFFNFFNNEIGITYQREFFKSQFNIIIPVVIGIEKPNITQSIYYSNSNYGSSYVLNQKLFDVGFGINYYPSLRTNVNYYIGPAFKYMQYAGTQNYYYYTPITNRTNTISKNSTLTRYTMSITNGVIFRTRSRITAALYGSLGFKNDAVNEVIIDPVNNNKTTAISTPVSLYFWCGFNVGFNF